jgi:hypothetical protein
MKCKCLSIRRNKIKIQIFREYLRFHVEKYNLYLRILLFEIAYFLHRRDS